MEAVEAAGSKRYDVIFMDGSMPEMDGFTATRLIRDAEARSGRKRATIVALTAQVRGTDADAWADAGADRHMTKPFTSARLNEALKMAGEAAGKPATAPAPRPAIPATPPPLTEPSLIDEEAVDTMRKVGARNGRDVVGKVWKLFLGQAPDAVFKLDMLAQGGDPLPLSAQAHFLKSMALSAGASAVAAMAEQLEHDAKAGRMDASNAALLPLRAKLEETCAAMRARMEAPPKDAAVG